MQHNFFDKEPLKTINRTHSLHSRTKRQTYLIVLISNLSSQGAPSHLGFLTSNHAADFLLYESG